MTSRCRQHVILVITFLVCFLILNVPLSGAMNNLKQGYSGPDVTNLQHQLQQLGFFSGTPTGYFGPVTFNAVTSFQSKYGLKPDGIAGQQTNSMINKLLGISKNQHKEVLGFYTTDEPNMPSSFSTVKAQSGLLTSVSPFWYRLSSKNPSSLELYGGQSWQEVSDLLNYSKKNNINNYVLIHNLMYGSSATGRELFHQAVAEPNTRWNFVTNIYNLVKDQSYSGVCIDIENIRSDDRGLYIQFLKELSSQFKPAGLKIIACVPSRTTDNYQGGWGDNFDYSKVGLYADQVVVMAYDEHSSGSNPGPIASKQYVEKVAQYSLTKLAPEKILLGVAGFGFDWNAKQGNSRYLSYQMAVNTAKQYNRSVQWDSYFQVPYYGYTDGYGAWHTVYFENASSLAAKLDIVNNYNLGGIAIWRLGMEDPASWKVIRDKLYT